MSSDAESPSAVTEDPPLPDLGRERTGLRSLGFVGLLLTQAFTALTANTFQWLSVPLAKPALREDSSFGDGLALALGLACFTLPHLILTPFAGYFADRFSKRSVMIMCKLAELPVILLGITALLTGQVWLLYAVVAAMGCQSAIFSPAKYGSIPELVHPGRLSQANGILGMVTVGCSAIGMVVGLQFFRFTSGNASVPSNPATLTPVILALSSASLIGLGCSLLIRRLPVADKTRKWPTSPARETVRDLKILLRHPVLLRTALGIGFFWMLASLANINIDPYGIRELQLDQTEVGPLLGVLVFGLGGGSLLAGWLCGGKAEVGIVPIGAFGIVVSSFALFLCGWLVSPQYPDAAYPLACLFLCLLGVSAGLFAIPLEAFLQERSSRRNRGTILAASNFLTFTMILIAAAGFYLLRDVLELSASTIFLMTALGTLPVLAYVTWLLPGAMLRSIVWVLTKIFYRIRKYGMENIPKEGPGLLVINHVSWLDGLLMVLICPRRIRMIAYADYINSGIVGWICDRYGVIPIKAGGGPKQLIQSLSVAREALKNGELVGIFAEGTLTRTGQMASFQPGFLKIRKGTGAPVVPVYLDELWGSIFSYRGGKFFWKKPRRFPYPISITFGEPITDPKSADEIHRAVLQLGAQSMSRRKKRQLVPPRQFLRRCRKSLFRKKVADSSGPASELTSGKLLAGCYVMKSLLEKHVLGDTPRDEMIGVLLPPAVGSVVVNGTLSLMRRVAVNLNYTLDEDTVNACIRQAGIRTVLTSRKFLEKRPFNLDANVILLEDLKEKVSGGLKLRSFAKAVTLPAIVQERLLGLHKIEPDDLLTVIFTSGSTGEPKGVMLSHHNVMSNIDAVDQLFHINSEDVLVGVLPFFHCFGYTCCLWLTLTLDPFSAFHFNPLDAKTIGKLAERYGMTIILATPTFLRTYLRRFTPEQAEKVNLIVVGAEKMPDDLFREVEEKWGVPPTEGYGATELSPVAAFNVPDHRIPGPVRQSGTRQGTVGRVMPGTVARVINPDSGEDLGYGSEGLLQIKGPNVMRGYLNQPEKTAEVVADGWYNTGDFAEIDNDGFIRITGRQSRFSKIGGEMVPHIRIEELLLELLGRDDESAEIPLAVTAVPDDRKGERLVVLHRPLDKPIEELIAGLNAREDIPNLWVPARNAFLEVEEIPILGTGKLDLKGLKELALERTAQPAVSG